MSNEQRVRVGIKCVKKARPGYSDSYVITINGEYDSRERKRWTREGAETWALIQVNSPGQHCVYVGEHA